MSDRMSDEQIGRMVKEAIGLSHHLKRTSPLGTDFIGTCKLCGKENMSAEGDGLPCVNSPSDDDIEAFIMHGPSLGY